LKPFTVITRAGLVLALAAAAGGATAQSNWRKVAVPLYGLDAYARGEALGLAGRAGRWAEESRKLNGALAAYCAGTQQPANLKAPRAQWAATAAAWDATAALGTGPLIERRSARSIDFMPPRPELLARAIDTAPKSAADMEQIGAPARGFPALELLLWRTPALAAGSMPCSYAQMLAADIEREAQALSEAARQRLQVEVQDEDALARLVETVNQWVGGVEQLRWAFMRKPLEVAQTHHAKADFPRRLSGQTAATWAARWRTLREAAVLGERPVPVPGEAMVPFETLLRGRGLNPLADRLVAATTKADRALQGLRPDNVPRVKAAAAALGELAALAQDELALALDVRMGFSDADGD
jgi:uncharacterized protein